MGSARSARSAQTPSGEAVIGRHRAIVAALLLLGVLAAIVLVIFAAQACPSPQPANPCPAAAVNRVTVVALAAMTVGLVVSPFAFLGEFVVRRRIVYRGAWARAARRGALASLSVAALAGLRLGGALTVPVAIFVGLLAALIEWYAVRRLDIGA